MQLLMAFTSHGQHLPKRQVMLLMRKNLRDLTDQDPRNYRTILYSGSCRFYTIKRTMRAPQIWVQGSRFWVVGLTQQHHPGQVGGAINPLSQGLSCRRLRRNPTNTARLEGLISTESRNDFTFRSITDPFVRSFRSGQT